MNDFKINRLTAFEQGYLQGIYLGDGYSNYNAKNRHYSVEFFLNAKKDRDIKEYLERLLRRTGAKTFEMKDKRSDSTRIRVHSKVCFNCFQNYKNIAEIIESASKEQYWGFLAGFIDAEGYVGRGEIVVTQKNKEILDKIGQICKVLGVIINKTWAFKNYKTDGDIWRMRISPKSRHIGLKSIKISRKYGGEYGLS